MEEHVMMEGRKDVASILITQTREPLLLYFFEI